MHYITIGYPEKPNEDTQRSVYNFFNSLKYLLPCEKCRYNFSNHLMKHPLTNDIVSSRDKLINWLTDIHNDVNISTGKPTITRDQMIESYTSTTGGTQFLSSFANAICSIDGRVLIIIITVVLIIIMILILRYNR
jgi:hypothetical protein